MPKDIKILARHRFWGFEPPGIIQRYKALNRILHNILPEGSGKLIMDLGCGSAPYFPCYTNFHKFIVGLDTDKDQLLTARNANSQHSHLQFDLVRADVRRLPIKGNTVDIIVATEVLEHTPFPSLTLREWHQTLKDDGYIILSVPGPYEFFRFSPSSIFLRQMTLLRKGRIGLLFKIIFPNMNTLFKRGNEKCFVHERPIIGKIIDSILPLFLSFKHFPDARHYNSFGKFVSNFYHGIPNYHGHSIVFLPAEWKSTIQEVGFKVLYESGALICPLPLSLFLLWKIKPLRYLFLLIEDKLSDHLKRYFSKSLIIVAQKTNENGYNSEN